MKQEGYVPDRDIIIALTADEESGPANGVDWLIKNHKGLVDAALVINEGGGGTLRNGKPLFNGIQAAEKVTTEWLAWTIRHTSGFLCAPMTNERANELDLPLMVEHNQDFRRTAYTVSVDAAEGVTTGISAHDRAETLRVLANPASGPGDLIRPGHIIPLRAVPGGVRERAAARGVVQHRRVEPQAGYPGLGLVGCEPLVRHPARL
jgi:acetylornithine deacetylase/succinyl-diaminopimelate desuccinylase-like protein